MSGSWNLERRDLHLGALFAAKPKPFPAPSLEFGVKGNCSCHEALLLPWACPRNSRELQVLRKIKIGKTTDGRVVTPFSLASSSWGTPSLPLAVVQLSSSAGRGWLLEWPRLALSLSPQPGSVPAFHQPCSSPKLEGWVGIAGAGTALCACAVPEEPWGPSFSPLCQQLHSWLSLLRFPLLQRGHADTSSKI